MFKIKKITGRYNKKTGVSFITHSVLNMGREFQTEEEYLTELINIKANYAEDIDPNFDRDTYVSQALKDNFGVRKDSNTHKSYGKHFTKKK